MVQPSLVRSIRRWELVASVVNAIIGAGIFGLPSKAFALAGPYSLLSFLVCAVAGSLIVLCFAEVASRFTDTGGPYLYAREAFGATVGFEVGWLTWLARLTSFSANANLMAAYLAYFLPSLASGWSRILLLTATVVVLVALNLIGIRDVTNTINIFAVAKLVPLAIFVSWGLLSLDWGRFAFHAVPPFRTFSTSVLLLVYAFTGFEMAVIPGGEMKDPRRDMPRALLIGMAVVAVTYILIQVVCIGTLPGLGTSERPLADAAARFIGRPGAVLITIGILFSLAGNLNTILLSASRMLFAMGERRELPGFLAAIQPRFRTPHWSILCTGMLMLTLTLSSGFVVLLTLSTISRLTAYLFTCAALIRLRRLQSAPPAAFTIPGGAAIAIAAIALGLWLLTSAAWREMRDTAIAAIAGILLFWLVRAIYRASR